MNKPLIELPKSPEKLGDVIYNHLETVRPYHEMWRLMVTVATWYVSGYREFKWYPASGDGTRVHHEVLDPEGNLPYQDNQLIYDMQSIMALLSQMDVGPRVKGRGTNLDMLRQKAAAQVMLDAVVRNADLAEIERQVNWLLVSTGLVGLHAEVDELPESGLYAKTQVVHPMELLPFPSTGADVTGVRGLIRRRYVPVAWLKETLNTRKLAEGIKNGRTEVTWLEHGEEITNPDHWFDEDEGWSTDRGAAARNPEELALVDLSELYMLGPAGTVNRYVVTAGRQVLLDRKYEDEAYCPLQVARMHENGTFWGLGHFQMAFSAHRQAERMRARLFKNVEEMDKYGILVIPTGTISDTAFKNVDQDGIRYVKWMPDPTNPTTPNPVSITPFNSGTLPLQVSQFARELSREVTPIPKLEEEFPRMESPTALKFLDQKGRRSLTNVTTSKANMYSGLYRSLCQLVTQAVVITEKALPVANLTLDLAGVKVDMETDSAKFGQASPNLVPKTGLLDFTIRHVLPINKELMVQEAMQALQVHQDPMRFWLYLCEHDLPFACFYGEEKAAYDQVVRNILEIVGNGLEAGFVLGNRNAMLPELQLRVLVSFMVGPVFRVLDPQIRETLVQYRKLLQEMMGRQIPDQLPTPQEIMDERAAAQPAQ